MAAKEERKQVPLRLSGQLYREISAWAEDDFRSLNGQIEFLLTECVRHRRRTGGREGEPEGERRPQSPEK